MIAPPPFGKTKILMRHAKARICRQAIYLWKPQWCPHKPLEHLRFLPRQAEWFPPNLG